MPDIVVWQKSKKVKDLPTDFYAHFRKRQLNPSIRKKTVIPHTCITHSQNNVCLKFFHRSTTVLYFFFLIHQKRKQTFKAVICVRTLHTIGFRLL